MRKYLVGCLLLVVSAGTTRPCYAAGAPRPRCALGMGKEGDRSGLPNGWAAYTGGRGVIWTPLRQYKPQVIAGTENERVSELEISDDGKWLLYVSAAAVPRGSTERAARLVLTRRDGSGYLKFRPNGFDEQDLNGGHVCGFFRNSPMADAKKGIVEIWYSCSPSSVRAALVDLSGPKPVIGKDREIVRVSNGRNEISGSTNGDLGYTVSGGRMWGGREMITIPGGGKGVATDEWIIAGYSGCGHALSHDGDLAVQNGPADAKMSRELAGAAGAENLPRGHSGFYMGHFYDQPAPRKKISQFFVTEGAAICLAPVQEEEFHDYNFTNNKEYLVCRKTTKGGNGANPSPNNGIWMVHWPSNTWTALERNERTKYWHPAAYMERDDKAPAAGPSAAARPAPPRTLAATRPAAKPIVAGKPASAPARITAKVKLVTKSTPARLRDMTYNDAYVVYEYEVVQVVRGALAAKTIAVAHWHWRDRKMVTASDKTVGQVYTLELEPYRDHPEFNDIQLANEMPDVFLYRLDDSYADVGKVEFQAPSGTKP